MRSLELEWQGKCDPAAVVDGAKVVILVLLRCRGRLNLTNEAHSFVSQTVEVKTRKIYSEPIENLF